MMRSCYTDNKPELQIPAFLWALALSLLFVPDIHAQSVGDHRSFQSGDWNAPYTWEQWNGSSWITEYPEYSPGSVMAPNDGFPVVAGTATSAKTTIVDEAHTIDLPIEIQSGDLVLIYWSDANNSATEPTLPAGWTELASSNSSTSSIYRKIWYRIADGTEGNSVSTTNTFGDRSAHVVYRIEAGSYVGTPFVSSTDNGTDDEPDPPSLAPGIGTQKFLWFATTHAAEAQTYSIPSNFGNTLASSTTGSSTNANQSQVITARRFLEAASLNPGIFSLNGNAVHSAWTVGIQGAVMNVPYPHPVVIATTTGVQSAADVSTHDINIPAGDVDDLLVAVFSVDGNPTVSTASAGWTKLGQASNGTEVTGAVFWKFASGTTPASDALSLTTSNNQRSSHITYRIRGATGISGTASNGNNSNSNPPGHSAAEPAFLWIATRAGDNTTTASAAPSGYTDLVTLGAGSSNGASSNTAISLLGMANNTQDPGGFTSSSEQWVCYTLAILGPAPVVTMIPVDLPQQASGNGYPSVVGSASSQKTVTAGSTHNVALPSGIQSGDLVMVFWADANTVGTAMTVPAGWTILYNTTWPSSNARHIALYRVADGSEGTILAVTAGLERSAHTAYRIAAGSYQGIPTATGAATGTSINPDPGSLTSGFGAVPTLWIAAAHVTGAPSNNIPASYTNAAQGYTGNTGIEHARMTTAARYTSAASENPGVFTLDASRSWSAFTIAVRGVTRSIATVRNGHTVTLSNSRAIDDLVVDNGGVLDLGSSSLTVNGTSIQVNGTINGTTGTLVLGSTSGTAITVAGSGVLDLYDLAANTAAGVVMDANAQIRGTLQLNDGTFTANGVVSLISNASGTGRLGPVSPTADYSGNLTVNRYVPGGATNWRLFGSPVQDRTVADWNDDFFTAGFPGSNYPNFYSGGVLWPSVRWYDETNTGAAINAGLTGVSGTAHTLAPGRGFAIWSGDALGGTNAFTVDVTGPPTIASGPVELPMTWTNTGTPGTDGWNLVSNPLPSPISFTAIARGANVQNAYWIFNPANGNNATWSGGLMTNGATGVIQSSQGFWMRTTGPAVTTTVSESAKTGNGSGGLFGGQEQLAIPMVRLAISSAINNYRDEAVVAFHDGAPGSDPLDARSYVFAHPQAPQISTLSADGEAMAISMYGGFSNSISIPVLVDVAVTGTYRITATDMELLGGLSCLTLEDLVTGTITPMQEGAIYSFSIAANASATTPRFMLHASAPIAFAAQNATCANSSDGRAEVAIVSGPTDVVWSDAVGNVLLSQPAMPVGEAAIEGLPAGNYQVSVGTSTACGVLTHLFTITEPFGMEAEAQANAATCADASDGSLAVEVLGGSAPYSYMWSNGATTATVEGIAPGEYAVSITDANGCSTTLEQLLVDAPDAINGEVLAESAVAANEPIFFASSAAPELAHGWDFGDGISSSEAAPQHVYSIPGEYTVTLTLSDGACSRTVQHVVSVFVTTGVQDVDSNGLRAWSTGTAIVLVNEASQAGDVHVYDSAGHLVATSRLAAGTERLEVPTADWPTGIYRLAVTSATDRWTIGVPVIR
jgi:hypothetical protein